VFQLNRYNLRVKSRLGAAFTVVLFATTPVLAHGGELIIAFVACAWLAPAAVALIAPWPDWKVRTLVTLVPIALGAAGLAVLFQTGTDRWPRLIGEVMVSLVVFGPAVVTALAIGALYIAKSRG
jgi:hypothetical protein